MTVPRQQISSMVRRLVTFPKGVSHYATHIAPRRWSIYAKVSLVVAVGGGVWAVSDYKDHIPSLKDAYILRADAAVLADLKNPTGPGSFRVDTATEMSFPTSISPSSTPTLSLVGLGVRTVSFLRVKVYSAGFYLEESRLGNLTSIPGWHTYTAQHLLTPSVKSSDALAAPTFTGEQFMKSLLDQNITCAVRIVPVRNTDFGHLRDGFTRAIAARQKLARAVGTLSEAEEERIAQSTQALKAIFPAQSVPKGKSLTLVRSSAGNLIVEYEGKVLGQVDDSWVSRELMLAYFADKDVISPKLKEDVARGLEQLVKK